jgi:hypothetical protein
MHVQYAANLALELISYEASTKTKSTVEIVDCCAVAIARRLERGLPSVTAGPCRRVSGSCVGSSSQF